MSTSNSDHPREVQMRALAACLAAAILLTSGCATVHQFDPVSDSHQVTMMTNAARNHRVTIELEDGRIRTGDRLQASRDTVSWYDPVRTGDRHAVHMSQVRKITINKRAAGAGRGALWGTVTGGLVLGVVTAELVRDAYLDGENALWVVVSAGAGAAAGAAIGALTGLIVGHKEEYVFESPNGRQTSALPSTQARTARRR